MIVISYQFFGMFGFILSNDDKKRG